ISGRQLGAALGALAGLGTRQLARRRRRRRRGRLLARRPQRVDARVELLDVLHLARQRLGVGAAAARRLVVDLAEREEGLLLASDERLQRIAVGRLLLWGCALAKEGHGA